MRPHARALVAADCPTPQRVASRPPTWGALSGRE